MTWLADAHREWHYVNGWDQVCPLDCGVGEGRDDYTEEDARRERWEAARAQAIATGKVVKV